MRIVIEMDESKWDKLDKETLKTMAKFIEGAIIVQALKVAYKKKVKK